MRLIQLCTSFAPGGIQRHALELAVWLRAKGHEVRLAGTPGAWAGPKTAERYIELPMRASTSEGGAMPRRVRALLAAAYRLRRHLMESPADLIHAHETAPAMVARLATLGMSTRIVMSCHGYPQGDARRVARVGRLAAHHVVSPSRLLAEELRAHGLSEGSVSAIGYGIQDLKEVAEEEVAQTRNRLLGDGGRVLAVVVARLAYQKGLDVLVQVVARVRSAVPDLRVAVVGGGPLEAGVRRWIRDAGVGDVLSLEGMRPDVERYLRAADFFLLTSRWEALPLSIVEAFRAGLPVIATNCGGVRELVDESVGAVVPVEDVDSLVEAVTAMATNTKLRQRMSEGARVRSRQERFSPEFVHRSIEAIYLALAPELSSHRSGNPTLSRRSD